jgi:Ca2+-binding EF-hand superfamily protein
MLTVFHEIDKNDDLFIDINEMKAAMRSVPGATVETIFNDADTNQDGLLDNDEFNGKFV